MHTKESSLFRRFRAEDVVFRGIALSAALGVILLLGGVLLTLAIGAWPALRTLGIGFFVTEGWNPVTSKFGALAAVYGTLMSSCIAVGIAIPIGLGIMLFLTKWCPRRIKIPIQIGISLLAGVPSIVFGIWGLFTFVPFMQTIVQPALIATLGQVPIFGVLFEGPPYGLGLLTAGVVLSIMILPYFVNMGQEALNMVPEELTLNLKALGALDHETFKVELKSVLPAVIGAGMLALGRALGETMAVAFVVGNASKLHVSLLLPATTISAAVANEFTEAVGEIYTSSLIALAFLLACVTLSVTVAAKLVILSVQRRIEAS